MTFTPVETIADVGVIVGRFQVAELHNGHKDLIQSVINRHRKVVILLGKAPLPISRTNPLDFESRMQMILADFPGVIVLYVNDVHDDKLWDKAVDGIVSDVAGPNQSVVLYGSRDSFTSTYGGRFPTLELEPKGTESGTSHRAAVAREVRPTADFRAGVIWASQGRYPTCFTAVDVAIFNKDYTQLLLGRKPAESRWRLVGGFSDPCSASFEDDARREAEEETGCNVRGLQYVKSFTIDDWRYRSETDCIKSLLFTGWTDDEGEAADDIADVRWFDLAELDPEFISGVMPLHVPLVTAAIRSIHGKRYSHE